VRARVRRVLVPSLLALAACASSAEPDDPLYFDGDGPADSPGEAWTAVGTGVAYTRVNTGGAILIAYGGYTARLSYSARWAEALVDARLGAAGVGSIYAVQGPQDASYSGKEIGNSKLRAHLATIDDGSSTIYVVGHSSGSFVAHELFDQLFGANNTAVLSRIDYADLDGGGAGLTQDIVDAMHSVTFAYAHDPTLQHGYSENNATARSLAADYAPHASLYEVMIPSTGCNSGAGWCLHDVLVTHRPHNASTYDLADDYTDFSGRPVTTEYFDSF
jgi:hypothetical protein